MRGWRQYIAATLKAAGRTDLALLAANVTAQFPKFALSHNGTDYPIATAIVRGAFPGQYPYGNLIEDHVDVNGMFSPGKVALLRQRASAI
jgi:hypothetical protein